MAKDLVSSGTYLSPASQAHCISVVKFAHSNIPTRDFTTRPESKEESKQAAGAADPRTAQPVKRSASSSPRVKAGNEKLPTIVAPLSTATPQARLEGAGEALGAYPDKGPSRNRKVSHAASADVPSQTSHSPNSIEKPVSGKDGQIEDKNRLWDQGRSGMPKAMGDPETKLGLEAAGNDGRDLRDSSPFGATLTTPVAPVGNDTSEKRTPRSADSGPRTIGCTMAPTKTAAGQEAASAQAVKRGPQVQIEEVPDDEDDTSFR